MKLIVLFLSSLVAGGAALFQLQSNIDDWRQELVASHEIMYVPSGDFLKPAVLGYDNVVADFLWARGISLFGERFRQSKFDPIWLDYLEHIVDTASTLDPLDHRIYKYGGLMLYSVSGYRERSMKIFEKGANNVDHFFLPLAVAIHALDILEDREKAAKYIQMAATSPDAPVYLKRLAASVMSKANQKRAALLFLEEQMKVLEDGSHAHLLARLKVQETQYAIYRDQLAEARRIFVTSFDRDPSPLTEMLGVTLRTDRLPPEPYGGKWIINPVTGAVESDRHEAALEEIRVKYNIGLKKDVRDSLKEWEESKMNQSGEQKASGGGHH